jgi:AcrR family transcriptional regulator
MILDAARSIVEERGFEALTTRAVTHEIGYTVGTLYQVFENLTALKLAVNAETVMELGVEIVDGTRDIADPKARLRQMSHRYVAYAAAHPDLWRLAFEHLTGAEEGHPAIIVEATAALFRSAQEVLAAIAPRLPAERIATLAAAYWSGVHGVCHLALSHKLDLATTDPADAVLDLVIDTFLAALETR